MLSMPPFSSKKDSVKSQQKWDWITSFEIITTVPLPKKEKKLTAQRGVRKFSYYRKEKEMQQLLPKTCLVKLKE